MRQPAHVCSLRGMRQLAHVCWLIRENARMVTYVLECRAADSQ
ncbi:hypothetical protein HanXRQr2_Chr11g0485351 [Helianthus annuus]|uniref:Uncharacterized protein n=1 Tax=Helianthus annuus TaxID=4232 RepID=A0A9K3HN62_HELAN|nr:hypothetical protein HanXRQr2_Chr11g0485351 [Helianthus annuus]